MTKSINQCRWRPIQILLEQVLKYILVKALQEMSTTKLMPTLRYIYVLEYIEV